MGFIYSYYFYKYSQKNIEITIASDESYRTENIYYFYVWNSGKTTIYKEDVINESGSIEISFEEDICVEYAKITDVTSNYLDPEIFHNHSNIKIAFDFLRPDEGFTILLKMVRPSNTYWHFEIKQQQNILTFPKVIKARGRMSNLYLFSNLFNYFLLAASVCVLFWSSKLDLLNFKGFYDVFMNVMIIGVTGFLIFMAPILIQTIKASRPPKELNLHYIENKK